MGDLALTPLATTYQIPQQDAPESLKGSAILLTEEAFRQFAEARQIDCEEVPQVNWDEKAIIALSRRDGLPILAELTQDQRVLVHTEDLCERTGKPTPTCLYEISRASVKDRSLAFTTFSQWAFIDRLMHKRLADERGNPELSDLGPHASIPSASDLIVPKQAPIPFQPIGFLKCVEPLPNLPSSPWLVTSVEGVSDLLSMLHRAEELQGPLRESLKSHDILSIPHSDRGRYHLPFVSSIVLTGSGSAEVYQKWLPTRLRVPTIGQAIYIRPSPHLLLLRVAKGALEDKGLSVCTSHVRETDGDAYRMVKLSKVMGVDPIERPDPPEASQRLLEEGCEYYDLRSRVVADLTGPSTRQCFGLSGSSRGKIIGELRLNPEYFQTQSK